MKHDRYKELLHLSFFNELDEREQQALDAHVSSCADCQSELEGLKKLGAALEHGERIEVDDNLLNEARQELRMALRLERAKASPLAAFLDRLNFLRSPGLRFALGTTATLVIGFTFGYFVFTPATNVDNFSPLSRVSRSDLQQSATRVSNFRLLSQAPEGGDVEFSFDVVTSVRMRGNMNDNAVQRIMAKALINDQNPGARIFTANALATQVDSTKKADKDIKMALIQAAKTDVNVGVRRQALRALQSLPLDKEIKDALLYILSHESNPSMRIDVINSLERPVLSGKSVDPDILNGLKQTMESDNNNFIRIKARNLYEEVQPQ